MPPSVRAQRVGYRLAYRVLQVVWFVFRPEVSGVKCLITHGNEILLVRHTYGPGAWDLPGGTMRRGEPALDAARREMHEELGIQDADWSPAGELRGRESFRNDIIYCFEAELASPRVSPNTVELATVRWFTRGTLPAELAPYVRPVLAGTSAG